MALPAEDGVSLLERMARRARVRWAAVALLAGGATGLFVGVAMQPLLGAIVALGVASAVGWRRARIRAEAVARHLNRTVPALEESAHLLLAPPEALGALERLQRERIEARLSGLDTAPRLPTRGLLLGSAYAAAMLLATAGWLRGGGGSIRAAGSAANRSSATPRPHGPPRATGVEIRVRPPRYTGRQERTTDHWDLDAEQGAEVSWKVRLDRPVDAVSLVLSDGDSLRARPRGPGSAEYDVTLVADHAALYQAVVHDGTTDIVSDYHRLGVIPDEPPTITIVHPEPRTTIAPGDPARVPLEVVAGDDYAVADASIVATVTAGSGEAVKFRELALTFDTGIPQTAGRTVLFRRTLDLAALQMGPGDELYFYVIVRDRREPHPNTGRSDTYFITLTDTAHVVVADLSGLAVNGLPEYLRSQRQIIIDTEQLLADAARISVPVLRDRSNSIGFDQHALRERYGAVAGDETVTQGTELTIEHEHDVPENTTLLAQSVKDKLQAALAQMWDAELRLRTYDPRAALPYEYRALDLLKQAQEATRAYVLRTGFEPAPLEPDRKRLTGTLSAIGSTTREITDTAAPTLPAVRRALEAAQRLADGGRSVATDPEALERAGRDIARLAIDRPGDGLETLRALRALIASLQRDSARVCRECAVRAARGLWLALPSADPTAAAHGRAGSLAQRYFDLLRPGGKP
jgi:hypothetical protein